LTGKVENIVAVDEVDVGEHLLFSAEEGYCTLILRGAETK
jgi:hypothetical protein